MDDRIKTLTLKEKASLCSGKNLWETKAIKEKNIESIYMCDGPHGLRKEKNQKGMGMNESVPAVCFPPAVTLASSFDESLLSKIGEAIGEHARFLGVNLVLGPGMNIKRHPLCGRNFEYFSEDPYLSGKLAKNMVLGIQSLGVGACLKHLVANNQEYYRMINDSIIDERALHEIYLESFRIAVTEAKPYAVMTSYNKLNGTYTGEHKKLLTDILRKDYGFDGFVLSDWGAVNDRVKGLLAGLDLEMPSSNGINDQLIYKAAKKDERTKKALDQAVSNLLNLMDKKKEPLDSVDLNRQDTLAQEAAEESMVLLKNDGALPLDKKDTLLVVGPFARAMRYQGAGSSKINPTKVTNLLDALDQMNVLYTYCPLYEFNGKTISEEDKTLITETINSYDKILLTIGLPESYESEGFDRVHLHIPKIQQDTIEFISKFKKPIVSVLFTGSPVVMPFLGQIDALLNAYLPGQAGGLAIANILYGSVNPSGKLAETFPLSLEDTPVTFYGIDPYMSFYKESIFVGYRFYDRMERAVLFPFGYGLSYTTFHYSDLTLSHKTCTDCDEINVKVTIRNTGNTAGKEVVQLYIGSEETVYKEVKKLRGFKKVFLEVDEEKTVTFTLTKQDFAYYNRETARFEVEELDYTIFIGASSQDIRLKESISMVSKYALTALPERDTRACCYKNLKKQEGKFTHESFRVILDQAVQPIKPCEFTLNTPLSELKVNKTGKKLYDKATTMLESRLPEDETSKRMFLEMFEMMPLRSLVFMSEGAFKLYQASAMIEWMNKHYLKAVHKFLFKRV